MSTKSGKKKLSNEKINAWIEKLQKNPRGKHQEAFIEYYRDLVESIARKFSKDSETFEDLMQVGMIGLLAALKRFDTSYGQSFESFAIPTIVGEIKRYIRDKTWSIHVPRRIKEMGPKIKKAVDELTTRLQRSPQIKEIAEYLDVSEEEVLETMEMGRSYRTLSVDSELEADRDGNTVTLLDLVGQPEEGFEQIDRELFLRDIIHVLTEREREIIRLTFYENLSQKQAGEVLGISQMHVSRLQRRALSKLRETIRLGESECS